MTESESPKPYHHGHLREQLLAAGEQALGEMPVEQVSLREIARRAGVSHAAPKHHFPSLGHLLGEVAARGYTRFAGALAAAADAAPDQSPQSRLLAMGRAYLRFAESNAAAYQLMFGQREPMVMTPNLITASYAAWSQLLEAVTAIVGSARAQGAALHVWSSVHGLSTLKLSGRVPPEMPGHNLEEQMLQMMLAGLENQ
ncbi:MAG: TetR/AcrR family transcriptional regulator [Alphaproteobacteria bacterium]|nr:TetR/AcrR family transcriptional regulator [Alphaproteobacteria bacterium]